MKKALTISLAQTLFTIEEDAYHTLESYLTRVRAHFENNTEGNEIVSDIESRVAEQFLDSKKKVITHTEVSSVIASMGETEQFDDGEEMAQVNADKSGEKSDQVEKTIKKLYRNPDDRVIAGVSSGVAHYLGLEVVWVRLSFVLLSLFNGFGVMVYLLLWLLTPEAKSASQKLQMKGSAVTLDTLETHREQGKGEHRRSRSTILRVIAFPFEVLRALFRFIFSIVFPVVRVVFGLMLALGSFAAMIALTTFLAIALSSSLERYIDAPIMNIVSGAQIYGTLASGYVVAMIPAFLLFLLAVSLLFRKNFIRPTLGFGLVGVWAVALIFTGASVAKGSLAYHEFTQRDPAYQQVVREVPILPGVRQLEVSFGQSVVLVQGTTTRLVANGRERDMSEISFVQEGDVLVIKPKTLSQQEENREDKICIFCDNQSPDYTLTVPSLSSLSVSHGSVVKTVKWESLTPVSVDMQYGSHADLELAVRELTVNAEQGSSITLRGTSASTTLNASFGSNINAEELSAAWVSAVARQGARIIVNALETLNAHATYGGAVHYLGTPVITEHASNGGDVRKLGE